MASSTRSRCSRVSTPTAAARASAWPTMARVSSITSAINMSWTRVLAVIALLLMPDALGVQTSYPHAQGRGNGDLLDDFYATHGIYAYDFVNAAP